MRRTLIGLAAAGLLVFTGCSDSDSGGGDSAGDDSAGGDSGGSETESFCAEFQELDERFSEDAEAAADVEQVLGALESLDPPEEIAEDFDLVVEVARQSAEVDTEDDEAMAELETLSEEASEAEQRVSEFIEEECDLGTDDTSTEDTTTEDTTTDDTTAEE
jgi:hypothetical protein